MPGYLDSTPSDIFEECASQPDGEFQWLKSAVVSRFLEAAKPKDVLCTLTPEAYARLPSMGLFVKHSDVVNFLEVLLTRLGGQVEDSTLFLHAFLRGCFGVGTSSWGGVEHFSELPTIPSKSRVGLATIIFADPSLRPRLEVLLKDMESDLLPYIKHLPEFNAVREKYGAGARVSSLPAEVPKPPAPPAFIFGNAESQSQEGATAGRIDALESMVRAILDGRHSNADLAPAGVDAKLDVLSGGVCSECGLTANTAKFCSVTGKRHVKLSSAVGT